MFVNINQISIGRSFKYNFCENCMCEWTILLRLSMEKYLVESPVRYIVGNPTSLRDATFHWLTSAYMQLTSGFMQLAAAGRRHDKVHFYCLFEGKC